MNTSENLNIEAHKTDIVVIGGGQSGLAAAVAADKERAKVIVLEKAAHPERKSSDGSRPFCGRKSS